MSQNKYPYPYCPLYDGDRNFSPQVAWQSEIVKFFNSQPWELRKEIILSERTYQIDNIWRCSIMPDDEFMFD